MGLPGQDNPLVGRFDGRTTALVADLLGVAGRRQRVRLVNRIGTDVPIRIGETRYGQLGALQERMMEEQLRLLGRLRLEPAGIPALFALDTTLLSRFVGLLLGEDPWGEPTPVDSRSLTPADLRVGRRILEDLVAGLNEALPDGRGQRFVVQAVDDDPRLDLGLPVSAGMFDTLVDFGDPESPMGLALVALPTSIVPVLWPEEAERRARDAARDERGLSRVLPLNVEAVAELARLRMPLSRIRALQQGDVIELGALRAVEVRVRGRTALVGEAGSVDGVRCIRVIRNVHDVSGAA